MRDQNRTKGTVIEMATELTPHFTLEEMCFSYTAARLGIKNMVKLDSQQASNLKALCENVLEPFRAKAFAIATPIHINSGYRSGPCNNAVGGANSSQHRCMGKDAAADITIIGMSPLAVCQRIIAMKLPFDQLILEFGQWTHVSYCAAQHYKRGQVLTAKRIGGKTKYIPGLVK